MVMEEMNTTRFPTLDEMYSFTDAREIIDRVASERLSVFRQHQQELPLDHVVGRTSKYDIFSPMDTPTYDSAAIEGYAVMRAHTAEASLEAPVKMRVMGSMTAGDVPLVVNDEIVNGLVPCVEITTGAAFPVARSSRRAFDAIMPWEHTRRYKDQNGNLVIEITVPPLTTWHKRLTGSDFRKGSLIVEKGTILAPKHIMALASVGITSVVAMRTLRTAVLSTGSELMPAGASPGLPGPYKIPDANGPYLTAALREMGIEVEYLGAYPDDADLLTQCLGDQLQAGSYDVIVSSGGVSSGKHDHIPAAVARLNGQAHFRYVAMKPGHPVLFASLPLDGVNIEHTSPNKTMRGQDFQDEAVNMHQEKMVAPVIFCLPGNPIASAACFRFLVTPYLRILGGMNEEQAIGAMIAVPPPKYPSYQVGLREPPATPPFMVEGSSHLDIFRQAVIRSNADSVTVEVGKERAPAKTSPFASSNCWIHVPRGHTGVRQGDNVRVFPFCSPKN